MGKFRILGAAIAALTLVASGAGASNLVTNGGFENLTAGPNLGDSYTDAVGWTTSSPGGGYGGKGYAIFFAAGAADTIGATDNNPINTGLWGPNNGSANGLPAASPTGGNFWASDADPSFAAKISQKIVGLTVGAKYKVDFDWAGAQLYCLPCGPGQFQGATSESFLVSLGGQSASTNVVNIASHGFSGWMHDSFTFTADSTAPVLSFLSGSGPSGLPPMALLDGVSLTAVPEPGTWALLFAGFVVTGVASRRRASRLAVTA